MKNGEYWKQRFEQLENIQHDKSAAAYYKIQKMYEQAQKELEEQIAAWYVRFADNNAISMAEARQWLTGKDLQEFKWSVKDYIAHGKENAINQQWMKQLENASAKYHISKLEALKIKTQQSLEKLAGNYNQSMTSFIGDVYQSGYYHTAFEIQKGFNTGWDITGLDKNQIDKIIVKPWAADGYNFSQRIWGNKEKLLNEIHNKLTVNLLTGGDPQKVINEISERMNVSKNVAGRLVQTEQAYFSSLSQGECLNDLGVEEYEILATLDSHTSEICRGLDGQHFPMKDYEPGVTAPPFHVNCRTTTVPYFADDVGFGERAARDENGKTYYVPDNMNYKEWQNTFVNGGDKSGLDVYDLDGITHYKNTLQTVSNNGTINKTKTTRDYSGDFGSKVGKDYYDKIHDVVDACQTNEAVEVWEKYEKDIKVGNANYKGHEYCSGTDIFINVQNDSKGNSWQAPYTVTFHESGHAIDHLNYQKGTGLGMNFFSSRYKDGLFPQTITDEVNAMIDAKTNAIKQAFKDHKGDWLYLYKQGFISDYDYMHYQKFSSWPLGVTPKFSKKLVYEAIRKEINSLPQLGKAEVSDIMGGATLNKLQCGFGHATSYWKGGTIAGINNMLATEAFADMYSATIANPESLKAIQKYLPKSYKIFLEMLDYLAKN